MSNWKGGVTIKGKEEDDAGIGLGEHSEFGFGRFEEFIQVETLRLCLSGIHKMVHVRDVNWRAAHMQMVPKAKRLDVAPRV